jgi:hypothetical protein
MSDPFSKSKAIRAGKLDSERPSYDEISGWMGRVPKTWLPALLVRIVMLCEGNKVFQEGGLEKVVAKAKADAKDPTWMLREKGDPMTPQPNTQEREKHSPTPWKCGNGIDIPEFENSIYDSDCKYICGPTNNPVNAARIVAAVNFVEGMSLEELQCSRQNYKRAYETLRAQLKEAQQLANQIADECDTTAVEYSEFRYKCRQLRDILNKL